MPRSLASLLALLVPCLLAAPLRAQGGWCQDDRFGFKFLPPRSWTQIPLKAEEDWLVAKYLSDDKYVWNDKDTGWSFEHQPELMVIAFVEQVIQNKKKVTEEEGEDGEKTKVVEITNPYKNYEDYLDRTYSGGGFYISAREEGTANDVPVTKLEIKVEKLAMTGPKHLVTWVFHAPGVDFAVQTEVLEDVFPKLKSQIQSTLRSFRLIERTRGSLPTEVSSGGLFISFSSMKKGAPEERREKRVESEKRLHQRALEALPRDWQSRQHKRFLLLFNTDPGYAERVAESGDALLTWVEEHLGFIGAGEYVRRPILRVCATEEQKDSLERGLQSSGGWSFGSGNEIVTCKDERGFSGWEMDWVNRRLLELWLRDRDDQLYLALPSWIEHGLYDYVEGARASNRKLQFRDYSGQLADFKAAIAQGNSVSVQVLIQLTGPEFFDAGNQYKGVWDRMAQADALVRFLLSPEAGRARQTKELLFSYLEHLRDVVLEIEGEDIQEKELEEPQTEEEEEEQYKKRHATWESSEREKELVKRVFQRSFGSWSPRDWDVLEKAFLRYAD